MPVTPLTKDELRRKAENLFQTRFNKIKSDLSKFLVEDEKSRFNCRTNINEMRDHLIRLCGQKLTRDCYVDSHFVNALSELNKLEKSVKAVISQISNIEARQELINKYIGISTCSPGDINYIKFRTMEVLQGYQSGKTSITKFIDAMRLLNELKNTSQGDELHFQNKSTNSEKEIHLLLEKKIKQDYCTGRISTIEFVDAMRLLNGLKITPQDESKSQNESSNSKENYRLLKSVCDDKSFWEKKGTPSSFSDFIKGQTETPKGISKMQKEATTLLDLQEIAGKRSGEKWLEILSIRDDATKKFYELVRAISPNDDPKFVEQIVEIFCEKWGIKRIAQSSTLTKDPVQEKEISSGASSPSPSPSLA